MKSYSDVINREARICYSKYMGGSNDYRPKNIDIISFIYSSFSVDTDIQEAFTILVENRGV